MLMMMDALYYKAAFWMVVGVEGHLLRVKEQF